MTSGILTPGDEQRDGVFFGSKGSRKHRFQFDTNVQSFYQHASVNTG